MTTTILIFLPLVGVSQGIWILRKLDKKCGLGLTC